MEELVNKFYEAHENLHSARWGGTMDEIDWREKQLAELRESNLDLASEAEAEAITRYNNYLRSL
jgi:hypothetical protein